MAFVFRRCRFPGPILLAVRWGSREVILWLRRQHFRADPWTGKAHVPADAPLLTIILPGPRWHHFGRPRRSIVHRAGWVRRFP